MELTKEQDDLLKRLYYTDENAWREVSMTLGLIARKGIKPENPVTGDMYMDDEGNTHIFMNNDWLNING